MFFTWFRIVFWDILPCKVIVDYHFTRQYIPEDNSEHHTRRRENLKSHVFHIVSAQYIFLLALYYLLYICGGIHVKDST
jgi:hypothetical protein